MGVHVSKRKKQGPHVRTRHCGGGNVEQGSLGKRSRPEQAPLGMAVCRSNDAASEKAVVQSERTSFGNLGNAGKTGVGVSVDSGVCSRGRGSN